MTVPRRQPGRPAKPMYSAAESAAADIESGGGTMSYESAAAFSSLSTKEIERAVLAGEIETFWFGRRRLIVRKSFIAWLAKPLAEQRQRREFGSK